MFLKLGAGLRNEYPCIFSLYICREMAQGDGRKETVAGNAFEGKVRSHEGRVLLLSHVQAVEPPLLPFSPHI